MQQLYTVSEVASRLAVSEAKIRKMVMAKEIQTTRIGRSVRFTADSVDQYLNRKPEVRQTKFTKIAEPNIEEMLSRFGSKK